MDQKKTDNDWKLTVEKLIQYLQQFNPKSIIYTMEMNTGDYQEIPEDLLKHFIMKVKDNKDYLKSHPEFFSEGKQEEEIQEMHKYISSDEDIILRF